MMKRVILFLMITAMFTACNNSTPEKKIVGKEVISSYANGTPQIERNYEMVDGERIATYEWEYYEDGNVLKEGPLSANERRDGEWKSYYRDGVLWSKGDYNKGIREGKTVTYHANGNKYYEGQFVKAQKSGMWKFYKENGEFDYEMHFDPEKKIQTTVDTKKLEEQQKSGN